MMVNFLKKVGTLIPATIGGIVFCSGHTVLALMLYLIADLMFEYSMWRKE